MIKKYINTKYITCIDVRPSNKPDFNIATVSFCGDDYSWLVLDLYWGEIEHLITLFEQGEGIFICEID